MTTLPVASVYTHALQGHACTVWDGDLAPQPLPIHAWPATWTTADRAVLAHCLGPTLDIGCGPGRMSEALALARPVGARASTSSPRRFDRPRHRGVAALLRSVFEPLPGEGRWGTALLADGNVGIGGDPVLLLERARDLLAPDGRVVVDLAPWGTGVVTRHVMLETAHGRSGRFPWTAVGADAIAGGRGRRRARARDRSPSR